MKEKNHNSWDRSKATRDWHFGRFRLISVVIAILIVVSSAPAQQDCRSGFADPPLVDPRDPNVQCLPTLGTWKGTINCPDLNHPEMLGNEIVPVGKCGHDSLNSWIAGHYLCNQSLDSGGYAHYAYELLLFHGKNGGLPAFGSGTRIGPSEILSETHVLAVADFDNDSLPDAVCYVRLLYDSSEGNHYPGYYDIGQVVVFWGQPDGGYSLSDTTRLSSGFGNNWLDASIGFAGQETGRPTPDLIIYGGGGLVNDQPLGGQYRLMIFRSEVGKRWGRAIPDTADWNWWNCPQFNYINITDADGDGNGDIALGTQNNPPGMLTVLYGKSDGDFPDTNLAQTIKISGISATLLEDLTNDGIPELITTGINGEYRVYVGFRGQRLKQQFGSGQDSAPGGDIWWGKPWRSLKDPHHVNSNWGGPYNVLYNLGDCNFSGFGDIAGFSSPWLILYEGGFRMDQYMDGMIDTRLAGLPTFNESPPNAVALLGDIDGSSIPTIAVGGGGVLFVKKSTEMLPANGDYNDIPPGARPASVRVPVGAGVESKALQFLAMPNPARNEIDFRWRGEALTGQASIVIFGESGQEVGRLAVAASAGIAIWNAAGIAAGHYYATLKTSLGAATLAVELKN